MGNGHTMFLGVPGTRESPTMVWGHLGGWIAQRNRKHEIQFDTDTSSGHLDLARSNLLRIGRGEKLNGHEQYPGMEYVAQKDTDVVLETPPDELFSYLSQDFGAHGAALVFSPTTSIDFVPQFDPLPGFPQKDCPDDAPFECLSGAGGFMVMKKEVADGLKVLGYSTYSFGTATPGVREKAPLYCLNLPETIDTHEVTEDVSLMRNVRESSGGRIVCDPRILTGHLKPVYRPSYRPRRLINPEAIV